jgi:type IV pilus assembly protein PilM
MSANVVGLDFGSRAIRAVEVRDATSARPTIVRYFEVPLPVGAVNRGEVSQPKVVATALRRLWSEGRLGSKAVVLGMGNHRVVARELTVPKMSLGRIRESLPFHVVDLLSVPVADALLDFYPISESEAESGPEVAGLLIAAVAAAVRGNVSAVQLAGLRPVGVDLIPFALSRVMARGAAANPEAGDGSDVVAQIDVGAGTTTVVISLLGVPQFVRLIPAGGDDLTQALSVGLSLDPDAAEALKRVGTLIRDASTTGEEAVLPGGLDPQVGVSATSIIQEISQELLNSLRNTVRYFTNTRHSTPVRRIVLSGGGSLLTGFGEELTELTRLSVATPGIPHFRAFGRGANEEAFYRAGTTYSVALGLALGSAA